jgi:hypothetical protein
MNAELWVTNLWLRVVDLPVTMNNLPIAAFKASYAGHSAEANNISLSIWQMIDPTMKSGIRRLRY